MDGFMDGWNGIPAKQAHETFTNSKKERSRETTHVTHPHKVTATTGMVFFLYHPLSI